MNSIDTILGDRVTGYEGRKQREKEVKDNRRSHGGLHGVDESIRKCRSKV